MHRLRDDIRLLGRILGDTCASRKATEVFDLVERIRQTSIRFHRDDDKPRAARAGSHPRRHVAGRDRRSIVRAFSYFSHLANIAEDQHHIRRTRAMRCGRGAARRQPSRTRWRAPARPGSARPSCAAFFDEALVSPVLTAHPTEVRRKSTLDREMEIARC